MGQAPPSGAVSVRTFNRNFPGRSGTADDRVYLCSPETAAATALNGRITDPRDLGRRPPSVREPTSYPVDDSMYVLPGRGKREVPVYKGPNIGPVPVSEGGVPDTVEGDVLIKLGDGISTDHILPGGAEILPLRSNIPAIAEHLFEYVDRGFVARAKAKGGGIIVGGDNYGQGSSREHAAAAPMHLGVRLVLAKSFARMHRDNLVNFGLPPLVFEDPQGGDRIGQGDRVRVAGLAEGLRTGTSVEGADLTKGLTFRLAFDLSSRQREILLQGGGIRYLKNRRSRGG